MQTIIKNPKLTPSFFFISLGVLVSLIASASSSLVLFFESLNKKFPDVLNSVYSYGYNSYDFESMRAALATLIIFFPIFILLSYFWTRESKEDMGYYNLILRKWMVYLILFLASLLIIIDLVTLVRYFVSGEITSRFILKVSGALFVGLLVDFYYSLKVKDVNLNNDRSNKWGMICGFVSTALFLGLIVWSFAVMGSPKEQRSWRLDTKRVEDLQSIQWQIINYWQQKEKLPEKLTDLSNPISSYYLPVDPEFEQGRVYEYIPKENLTFELCATFTREIQKGWNESGGVMPMYKETRDMAISSYPYPDGGVNESWEHKEGRTCFTRTIDKDIYPPFEK